jgi:hypothetical protein
MFLSGELPDAEDFAGLAAINTAWVTYTPAWTSTGTAPAIGNGTLEGRYLHAGKLMCVTGRIVMGSTTTFGTGLYSMSMPSGLPADSSVLYSGSGLVLDSSAPTANGPCAVRFDGGSAVRFYAAGGQVGATVPFTWANGDQLIWQITYATSA